MATGNIIGLSVVALVFVSFALISSFIAPRRWPDFPGKNGLSVFVIASFVLFAAMLTACMLGRRFAIVTFALALGPWYEDCVAMHGLAGRCAGV